MERKRRRFGKLRRRRVIGKIVKAEEEIHGSEGEAQARS
jgi:hypothetical protein